MNCWNRKFAFHEIKFDTVGLFCYQWFVESSIGILLLNGNSCISVKFEMKTSILQIQTPLQSKYIPASDNFSLTFFYPDRQLSNSLGTNRWKDKEFVLRKFEKGQSIVCGYNIFNKVLSINQFFAAECKNLTNSWEFKVMWSRHFVYVKHFSVNLWLNHNIHATQAQSLERPLWACRSTKLWFPRSRYF